MRVFSCLSCAKNVTVDFTKCRIQMGTGNYRLDLLPIKLRPGYCHSCDGMASFAVFSVDEDAIRNPIDDLAVQIETERDRLIALSRNAPSWFALQKQLKQQKRRKAIITMLETLEAKISQAESEHFAIEQSLEYAKLYWGNRRKKPSCITCFLKTGRTTQRDKPIFHHHCGAQITVRTKESLDLRISGIAFGQNIIIDAQGELIEGGRYRTAVGKHHWVSENGVPLPQ